jgi:tRNA U38,U39,U40 pseudouridine synthase TruA
MTREQSKGTDLPVFRGTKAKLNRAIFEVLRVKTLASYDAYLEIRRMKGHRHYKYQVIDRRLKRLYEERWILKNGTKKTKPGTDTPLYELSLRGQTALEMDKTSRSRFLREANDDLLLQMKKLLAEFRESTRKASKN